MGLLFRPKKLQHLRNGKNSRLWEPWKWNSRLW